MRRLAAQPSERIDRSKTVSFTFDGEPIVGYEGDTIASALLASGRQVLSRSFKYHRPRGELCGCGQCTGSLVQVDGAPGVRGCAEPVRDGMRVEHQNAWPSLDFDAMRVVDRLGGPFTPVGFYYKTFIWPRRLWPVYERMLRRAAGLGRVGGRQEERSWRTEYCRRHCDVLVVGGGVAGLSAALAAARLGADVVLCDEDVEPGGAQLAEGGSERMRKLAADLQAAGAELLTRACALGHFDGLAPVWQRDVLHQIRAREHVIATGTIEQPLLFPNNDLPGIVLASGVRRLLALYALGPRSPVVVAGASDGGMEAALALHEAGVRVAAVADLREDAAEGPLGARIAEAGIELQVGATIVHASGRGAVERVTLARVGADGRAQAGSERQLECDLVAVSGGTAPAGSLLLQAGAKLRWDASGRFLPAATPSATHGAGSVVGHGSAEAAEISGTLAGLRAALAVGLGDSASRGEADDLEARLEAEHDGATAGPATTASQPAYVRPPSRPAHTRVPSPPAYARSRRRGRVFVDLDEDVTVKDVRRAAEEGFDCAELSKRYTTVGMGPSQGRFSQLAAARVLAEHSGVEPGAIGTTTARPPWSPVPLGALAGPPLQPAKRSALHARHRELGASIQWAGDWRRAYDYGDPTGEALAVHQAAGIIDVSTLGKLIVRGQDAGELLDRIYPNKISNLGAGRVRYGVLLSETGRISDDGTVCRLDEETFYLTTTSSGAEAMEQWFTWWLSQWQLRAHVTEVSQGVSAVNLAGPNARQILERVSDLDFSKEAFPYLHARQAPVAEIPCLLMRIGFVGELGYEIHCSAVHGQQLWDALCRAGADLALRPFGLEPQRVLRLQKQHILVGQDTDSESTPAGAAMEWIVKMEKEQQFLGRWALEDAAGRPSESRLVGFTVPGGQVPTEGAVVLAEGAPAGQVTSARRSAQLGETIGMAWVPVASAQDQATIEISDGGRSIEAIVRTKPFYDPDGEVLRS